MGFDLLLAGGPDNRILPPELLGCVVEVRIEQSLDEPTRFAIRFLDDIVDGRLKKATLPALQLGEIITIAADRGDEQLICLCRGPILSHESEMTLGGPGSSLTVLGPDRRDEMGREMHNQNWPGRASDVVRQILSDTYPRANVDPTDEVYDLNGNSLPQRATDLDFVTKLASSHGHHFWISYSDPVAGPDGRLRVEETANWKASPPLQDGIAPGLPPQLTLTDETLTLRYNVPRTACPNLTRFRIATDGARPSEVRTLTQNLSDSGEDPVELGDQAAPMGGSGAGLASRAPARALVPMPQGNASAAQRTSRAALRDAGFFVRAEISTTRHLLRDLLQPHQTVGVEGIGGANGRTPFRVARVTHVINGINHFMDAEIETNVQLPT